MLDDNSSCEKAMRFIEESPGFKIVTDSKMHAEDIHLISVIGGNETLLTFKQILPEGEVVVAQILLPCVRGKFDMIDKLIKLSNSQAPASLFMDTSK